MGLGRPCLEEPCETVYRTLWIAPHGGMVKILELPDLIVPRQEGFWRVGVRTYCDPEQAEHLNGDKVPWPRDTWFAAPVKERPVVVGRLVPCPARIQEDNCGGDNVAVTFVNAEYVSLERGESSECGVHPDFSGEWTVERLGDHDHSPLVYSAIKGPGTSGTYERLSAHALMDHDQDLRSAAAWLGDGDTEEDRETRKRFPKWSSMTEVEKVDALKDSDLGCFQEHNDREWFIKRDQGRWIANGAFNTHRLCGYFVDFELPLPIAFAETATGPLGLNEISKQVPDAYDAFWSPNLERVVVLVRPSKQEPKAAFPPPTALEVFSPRGSDLGKPTITMSLMENEGVVMVESATGSNVAQWTTELMRLKAQGVVKPLLTGQPSR